MLPIPVLAMVLAGAFYLIFGAPKRPPKEPPPMHGREIEWDVVVKRGGAADEVRHYKADAGQAPE